MGLTTSAADRMIRAAFANSNPATSNRWMGLIPLTTGRRELVRASYKRALITSSNFSIAGGRLTFDPNEADFLNTPNNLTSEDWGTIAQYGIYSSETADVLEVHDRLRDTDTEAPTVTRIGSGGLVSVLSGNFVEVEVRTSGSIGFGSAAAGRAVRALFSDATPSIGNRWIALMTSATAELNRTSYQRAPLTSANYVVSNGRLTFDVGELDFVSSSGDATTEDWGTITHWGVYTAASGGTLDYVDNIRDPDQSTSVIEVGVGGTLDIPASQYVEFPSDSSNL